MMAIKDAVNLAHAFEKLTASLSSTELRLEAEISTVMQPAPSV